MRLPERWGGVVIGEPTSPAIDPGGGAGGSGAPPGAGGGDAGGAGGGGDAGGWAAGCSGLGAGAGSGAGGGGGGAARSSSISHHSFEDDPAEGAVISGSGAGLSDGSSSTSPTGGNTIPLSVSSGYAADRSANSLSNSNRRSAICCGESVSASSLSCIARNGGSSTGRMMTSSNGLSLRAAQASSALAIAGEFSASGEMNASAFMYCASVLVSSVEAPASSRASKVRLGSYVCAALMHASAYGLSWLAYSAKMRATGLPQS